MPEARIVVRDAPEGKKEISVVDPATGREARTGLTVAPAQLDGEIRKIKTTLERSGSQVSVKE